MASPQSAVQPDLRVAVEQEHLAGLQGEAYRLPGGIHAAVGGDDGADHRVFTVWMGAYHADVAAHDLHAIQLAAQGTVLRRDEALRTDGGVHRLLLGRQSGTARPRNSGSVSACRRPDPGWCVFRRRPDTGAENAPVQSGVATD